MMDVNFTRIQTFGFKCLILNIGINIFDKISFMDNLISMYQDYAKLGQTSYQF